MKGVSIYRMKHTEQVYTFRMSNTGEVYHFAVDQLLAYIKAKQLKPEPIILHYDLVKHMVEKGGAELPHLERLPEVALAEPGVLADMGDGSHVLVDGVHRALRCFLRGDETFPAYMVHEQIWRRFLITDFPTWAVDWEDFLENGDRTNGPKPIWDKRS